MANKPSSRVLSTPKLGLVWFGASVSLAEILTGTFFAPLGIQEGLSAILVGHLIGCVLFMLVAYVSAKSGVSAMDAARRSFGNVGGRFFAAANVVQLVGWTAIMVLSGAAAATLLVPQIGVVGWSIVIGVLIVVWIAIGVKRMGTVQSIMAVLLFALTIVVSFVVFGGGDMSQAIGGETLSFGAAVELAVAMPLSWLPVVGDYTRAAKKPLAGSLSATCAYFIGSCWMFVIGLGCALFAGSDDLAVVLSQAGLGIVGIIIVVVSTVTTTFLDAQSAGVSAKSIWGKLDDRICGIVATAVGVVLAITAPVSEFEEFLYLIGSVFAPMAALVIADFFITKRDLSAISVDWRNIVLWLAGFVIYRISLQWDLPCGNTIAVIAIIVLAAVVVEVVSRRLKGARSGR